MKKLLLSIMFLISSNAAAQEFCNIGDYLYQDLTCSDLLLEGQIPQGIVFDSQKRLAVSLMQSQEKWSIQPINIDITPPQGFVDNPDVGMQMFNGKEVSQNILTQAPNYFQAAQYCNNLPPVSQLPWFLPAIGSLNLLYINKATINDSIMQLSGADALINSYYWSSSQQSFSKTWKQSFLNGEFNSQNNNTYAYVRCIVNF